MKSFRNILVAIKNLLIRYVWTFWARRHGLKVGSNVVPFGVPIISMAKGSLLIIKDRVTLISNSRMTALGVNHPVIIRTISADAKLIIEDDVGISGGTICASKEIVIGASSMLGANVIICDTDFHPISSVNRRYNTDQTQVDRKPIFIEKNVFIGTNTTILKGVTIGQNSVIGAGSVVTGDIPANVVAAGNPCRVIRSILGGQP